MKRVFCRAFSMVLVAALLTTTFAGCGKKDEKSSAKATTTNETFQPVTLKVEVFDRGVQGQTPPADNYWTKWIKEQTKKELNIDLEFVAVPRSEEEPKLTTLMAAGTPPDVVFTYSTALTSNFYKNGGLTDLAPSLDKYGKDLKTFLTDNVLQVAQDGKVQYAIPAKRVNAAMFGAFIRQDWLDKLNLPLPKTTEEWYNDMKLFKEKNPGNVSQVIPVSLDQDIENGAKLLFYSFVKKMTDEQFYENKSWFLDGYKDGVRFLNKMYNEGLIAPEFALDKDGSQARSQGARGLIGFSFGNYDQVFRPTSSTNEMMKAIPGSKWTPVDCFTNPSYGNKTWKPAYDQAGMRVMVPKASEKRVDAAIRYLNWMCKNDVLNFLQTGEEGVHKNTNADGLPVMKQVDGEKKINSTQNLDYTLIVNGLEFGNKDKNVKAMSLNYPGFEKDYIIAYNNAMKDSFVEPTVPVPCDADSKYGSTLTTKSKEMYAKLITCKPSDFDKVWDAQISEYLKAGGQEILDGRKKAWKEQKGTSTQLN